MPGFDSTLSGNFVGLGRTGEGYVPQPFYVHVDFGVGNPPVLLTGPSAIGDNIFINNARFKFTWQSFTHSQEMASPHPIAITLFDKNWIAIESFIQGHADFCAFRYYYIGPNQRVGLVSPVYTCQIMRITPTLSMAGTTVVLEGLASLSDPKNQIRSFNGTEFVKDKNSDKRAYYASFATKPLSPTDILKKLSDESKDPDRTGINYMFDVDISTPSELITEPNALHTTEEAGKAFVQGGMSDLTFIQYLVKNSYVTRTVKNSETGKDQKVVENFDFAIKYREGLPPLVIAKPVTEMNPDDIKSTRTFTYLYGDPNSEIISFTPSIDANMMGATSAGGVAGTSHSLNYGVINETTSDIEHRVAPFSRTDYVSKDSGSNTAAKAPVQDHTVYTSLDEANSKSFAEWYQSWLFSSYSTLVIQGDWRFDLYAKITMLILTLEEDNYSGFRLIHPASGDYRINKITHTLSAGSWETELELFRAGMFNAAGDRINAAMFRTDPVDKQPFAKPMLVKQDAPKPPVIAGSAPKDVVEADITKFPPPLCGSISSEFGDTEGRDHAHGGIDIPAPKGTPIYAPEDGEINTTWSFTDNPTAGNSIAINTNGITVVYMHLDEPPGNLFGNPIKKGTTVKKGDLIGYVGSTGHSDGNHLHLEVKKNGKNVDPIDYFNPPSPCP